MLDKIKFPSLTVPMLAFFLQVTKENGQSYLSCNSGRSFRSVRERWWYIALSKCGVRYYGHHILYFLSLRNSLLHTKLNLGALDLGAVGLKYLLSLKRILVHTDLPWSATRLSKICSVLGTQSTNSQSDFLCLADQSPGTYSSSIKICGQIV